MGTSARNNRQRGLTLVEALVTLAIIAMGAGLAASAFNARSLRIAVDYAASELLTDLKRARLMAETTGSELIVEGSGDAYQCAEADIDRRLPAGVIAEWNGASAATVTVTSGFDQKGARIRLSRGTAEAIILIERFTGRIRRGE